jgi:serine palmitoyltransferase
MSGKGNDKKKDPEIGMLLAFLTYANYAMLVLIGHLRDFFANLTGITRYPETKTKKGYSVLLKSWESFFKRRLYHRVQDCWNRPICSSPGAHFDVMLRVSADENCSVNTTGESKTCLNLGSYNYLGFADDWREYCGDSVLKALDSGLVSTCSSPGDLGRTAVLTELEEAMAKFLGKEAAFVCSMGYGTNSTTIPALMGEGSLIISDSLNHTSLVNGSRGSSAMIRVFRHNDPEHLEQVLRESIINGQPRIRRPWRKVLVMVEGIYSMEGAICHLAEVARVCKKYKAYLYVDEAHSIGALGATGRGVTEYCNVNPDDVDVLMGTFSKSFGGMGGYIAGSAQTIASLKAKSAGALANTSLSPVVCEQILTALKIIANPDPQALGLRKIRQLHDNCNYFRQEMERIGMHVYGDYDSPIIPVLIYLPGKVAAFSRLCLERGVAVVVVGFPATSLV